MPNAVANAPILQKTLNTFLLIPSRFPPIRLYERIAGDFHDAVTDLEALTNPRLRQKEQIIETSGLDDKTYTRADWLFAYWVSRAAGYLKPETGRGTADAITLGIEAPAWATTLGAQPLPMVKPERFK